ncbi:MAG: polyribonucleotide nucleotidyltransferase [Nitrospirota bacterium]
MIHKAELDFWKRKLTLETGRVARQADGAVLVRYEDTVILATVVASKNPKEDIDFLPLTVDYQEKAYAAGKIPGGFFKREGRPGEKETLASRLIDRPIRPLFPDGYYNETQVIITVLSVDQSNASELLGIIGASAALSISDIPFSGPVGAVRIGRINNEFIINPGLLEIDNSELNLIVAGTKDAVVMVEGGALELSETVVVDAIEFAHKEIQKIIEVQEELVSLSGRKKRDIQPAKDDPVIRERVEGAILDRLRDAILIPAKLERQNRLDSILEETLESLNDSEDDKSDEIRSIFHELEKKEMRKMILEKGTRADGRKIDEIRPISCEIGILPRTHGSALFTRGETQCLAIVTLGTAEDRQRIDSLDGESSKTFMLHYNFPPFSVGEVKFLRSPGRREIGHGALAERALKLVIPEKEEFPYTLRIVSDILESNGSSSMATVCGGTLALMDAGVPIKIPVAGIAMGLIKEEEKTAVLSDILGLEDHLGDMDFKVTGSRDGITALQMDIKIAGVTKEIMLQALQQAREGRLHILKKMLEIISVPRPELSIHAPRIITMKVKSEKVRDIIGQGGKVIRGIIEKTGVKIDIEDNGMVSIISIDEEAGKEAMEIIHKITEDPEVGKIYLGKVKKVTDFGAFVEILPNTDGLVHISQLANYRVKNVEDEVSEGDEVMVKVLEIDRQGKIRLSRKECLKCEDT